MSNLNYWAGNDTWWRRFIDSLEEKNIAKSEPAFGYIYSNLKNSHVDLKARAFIIASSRGLSTRKT